jgi:beta-lactam-binding protein with PASTA domain
VPGRDPAGTVVSQFPKAGKRLKRGGDVLVDASDGSLANQGSAAPAPPACPQQTTAEQTSVPNVVGEDDGTAFSTLQEAGFGPRAIEAPVSSADQDGLIQKQQPAGGKSAPPGSTVTIYIGRFSQTG